MDGIIVATISNIKQQKKETSFYFEIIIISKEASNHFKL